jgi:dipeptidyl-peptidase-4
MRHKHPILLLISILFISSTLLNGQNNKITLDKIYHDYTFYSKSVRGINSMSDGKHYTVNNRGVSINKHSYANGEMIETLFNAEDFDAIQSFNSYEFSLDEQFILLTTETESIYRHSFLASYYIYNVSTKELLPLSPNGKQQLASISPNNEIVAFVRENNIYMVDLESMVEMQLTYDGKKNEIINGAPDWVYEEEFGFADGFKWSQDGSKLAFYRFDESKVRQFFMSMYGELYPDSYEFKYPKAGEQNSDLSIHVYDLNEGMTI